MRKINNVTGITVLLIFLYAGVSTQLSKSNESQITVMYVANEGVLVSENMKKILIDGLHRKYKPAYAWLPDSLRRKAELARPPFNDIDMVLVTHIHRDHFHSESVGLHLLNNPKAQLVTSNQVADSLKMFFRQYPDISSRVNALTPDPHKKKTVQVEGIEVSVLNIPHGSERFRWIEHSVFLIKMGGHTILHVGDAIIDPKSFETFDLIEEEIDFAFIPYWFLLYENGQKIVENYIQPKRIFAMHISPQDKSEITQKIKSQYPEAVPFIELMKRYQF